MALLVSCKNGKIENKKLNIFLRMIFPCQIIGIYLKQSFAIFIRKAFPFLPHRFSADSVWSMSVHLFGHFDNGGSVFFHSLDITINSDMHTHQKPQPSTINHSIPWKCQPYNLNLMQNNAHHIKKCVCMKLNTYIYIFIRPSTGKSHFGRIVVFLRFTHKKRLI